MLNKKLIAIAIAAGFSANAAAAIDTNETVAANVGTVAYANEAIPTLTAGKFALTNAANALDIEAQTGFTIPANATRYVRVNLTNGTFGAIPAIASGVALAANAVAAGGNGSDYVIFSVTAGGADLAAANVFTIASATYNVDPTASLSASYSLYETAGTAVAQSTPLATSSATMVTYANANTGDITTPENATATVTSQFTAFSTAAATTGNTDTATLASVLGFTPGDAVTGTFIKQNGTAFAEADLFGGSAQNVTVTGNFGFGTWKFGTAGDCSGAVAVTINTAETSAVASTIVAAAPLFLCVTVDTEETIAKGTYSISTTTPAISAADAGSIVYDTTSISIPYLTTFSDYNQRVYIRNDSSVAASYTTSFVSESGTTAVAGTAATGSVPGNSLIAIKASDLVTITGGTTRTSAVIEIEATAANVTAITQTVNLSDKSTDTVSLTVE